jgi:dephospho-CoA kinase
MNSNQSEQERIKRIRDQQIRTRDPQTKERKISRQISTQQKKKRQNESFFKDAIRDVSHKAKGVYIGALLGLIILLVLPYFVEGKIATTLGIIAIPVLILLGFIYGASFDWRDELSDDLN